MTEFDLIRTWFSDLGSPRLDVVLGVGDDCALLRVPKGQELAVSIDTLVSGTHFLPNCDPEALGHKALAVGLSDLAAMGAVPAWATLALTLPPGLVTQDPGWIAGFARGLDHLARAQGVRLVGGDTTSGPLVLTLQVHGLVPEGGAIRRSGTRPGDLIYVSGTLGDAGLALRQRLAGTLTDPWLQGRLDRPSPRVALGLALRGLATAMIDLSDGLAADLGHILESSGVGAELRVASLPLSPPVAETVALQGEWDLPLASGDDYELCFCVPSERVQEVLEAARGVGCPITQVGRIREGAGLRCIGPDGSPIQLSYDGFDHFRETGA